MFVLFVSSGMEYIHSKHVIHRDLKTENCLCFQKNEFRFESDDIRKFS